MCGLIGVFGNSLFHNEEEFFKDGLIASQLRGQDSTGLAVVHGKNSVVRVLKGAYDSSAFVSQERVQHLIGKSKNSRVFLGHTRFATQGSVKDEHAHPFTHDHITLAHNGGISNKNQLPGGAKFDVDSEAICHSIAKIGAIETLKKVNGAFALSFFDADKNTFNLIRNMGRNLFITKHKHKGTWFYGSEGEMLFWLLRRNNIEHEEIKLIPNSHLAVYDLGKEHFEISEVDYTPSYTKTPHWNMHGHMRENEDTEDSHSTSGSRAAPSTSNVSSGMGRNLWSRGPDGAGAQHLHKWGLHIGSWIMVHLAEVESLHVGDAAVADTNPERTYMKGHAMFACKEAPETSVTIFGFTLAEYDKVKTPHSRYFTRITQCFWDATDKVYKIHTMDLYNTPPKGGKVDIPKAPEVIVADVKPPLILPPPPKAMNKDEVAETVVTLEELEEMADNSAREHAHAMARIRDCDDRKDEELVNGPHGSKITFRRWKEDTDDGCSNCSGSLYVAGTDWYSDCPVHKECLEQLKGDIKIAKEQSKVH